MWIFIIFAIYQNIKKNQWAITVNITLDKTLMKAVDFCLR